MTFDADALRRQIPYYLTADPAQKVLLAELKSLSEGANKGYFIPKGYDGYTAEMLQGDGWRGFQVFSFANGNLNPVQGIVLSNSCDVTPGNARVLPAKITFAPIVKLSKIQDRFEAFGLGKEQVDSRLEAIRSRGSQVSSTFRQTNSSKRNMSHYSTIFTPCPSRSMDGKQKSCLRSAWLASTCSFSNCRFTSVACMSTSTAIRGPR